MMEFGRYLSCKWRPSNVDLRVPDDSAEDVDDTADGEVLLARRVAIFEIVRVHFLK